MKSEKVETVTETRWYSNINGKQVLHREDGPAIVFHNGGYAWYQYDELHREDGPAIAFPGGDEHWYLNGVLHREGGPAVDEEDYEEWYHHGNLHRIDGPAATHKIDKEYPLEWAVDGIEYKFDDYCEKLNYTNEDKLILKLKYNI